MDSDETREVVKRFWCRVQKEIGPIPLRVRGLLDLLEISATRFLGSRKTDWSKLIQERIQKKGNVLFNAAKKRGFTRTRSEVFGPEHHDLGKFELGGEEVEAIEDVSRLIQTNGIRPYIAESPVRAVVAGSSGSIPAQPNQSNVVLNSGQLKQILLEKLASYYRKRRNLGISSSFFKDLQLSTESELEDRAMVRVPCPKCNHKPGCTRNGNTWVTNNYYQHVRTHIRKESEARSARRSQRHGGPSRLTRAAQRRSLLSGPNLREASTDTDEEGDEESQHGESSEEVIDGVENSATLDPQAQSAMSGTDANRGEDGQQPGTSREVLGSVVDRTAEQGAGSGDGGDQPSGRLSVNALVAQFSEGTKVQSRRKSEN